jgi:polysaccharide deacetylase 2 family uncharacterized protein YibQ
MARYRLTSIRLVVVTLALVAGALVALGSAVALMGRPAAPTPRLPPPPAPCTQRTPCLALVIDDVGRELAPLRRLLALPLDLTFSVLPHAPKTPQSLKAIRARGREVMLHLPMAPLDSSRITDERVVLGRDGPLEAAMRQCLAKIPDAVGVNNHMGSALSKDPGRVGQVLEFLRGGKLWFLDSRTVAGSLFCSQAQVRNIRCIERDVFLDDPPTPSEVKSRITEAVDVARRRGWAVAIGHPKSSTVDALQKLRLGSTLRIVRLSTVIGG